jgi:hypothetical protein
MGDFKKMRDTHSSKHYEQTSKQSTTKTKTPTTAPKICCGDAGIMIKQVNNISTNEQLNIQANNSTNKQTKEYKHKSPATAPKT